MAGFLGQVNPNSQTSQQKVRIGDLISGLLNTGSSRGGGIVGSSPKRESSSMSPMAQEFFSNTIKKLQDAEGKRIQNAVESGVPTENIVTDLLRKTGTIADLEQSSLPVTPQTPGLNAILAGVNAGREAGMVQQPTTTQQTSQGGTQTAPSQQTQEAPSGQASPSAAAQPFRAARRAGQFDAATSNQDGVSTLNKLLQVVGAGLNPDLAPNLLSLQSQREQRSQALNIAEMEVAGELALKGIESEEQLNETASEFVNNAVNPEKFSTDSASDISLAETATRNTQRLLEEAGVSVENGNIQVDENIFTDLRIRSPQAQAIKGMIDEITNAILRIESGAAITKDDQEFAKKLNANFNNFLQAPEENIRRLASIQNRLGRFTELANPNSGLKDKIQTLKSQGFSDQEIYQAHLIGALD